MKCGVGEGWSRSVGGSVRNKEVLHRFKEDIKTKRRKANRIGHILRKTAFQN